MAAVHFSLFWGTSSPSFQHKTHLTTRRTYHSVHTCKLRSFLDLKPEFKPEEIKIDLSMHDRLDKRQYDVIVLGGGPSGLRLADRASHHGLQVCVIDPSPKLIWPNNYGVWVDEFESLGLDDCLDVKWKTVSIHINENKTKFLNRPYGRVNRKSLKLKLLENCVSGGVKFHRANAKKITHEDFEGLVACDDGGELKTSLIVDATGFSSRFTRYNQVRNDGYQIAHGILAEVKEHPFDLDKMLLMDWRDSHLDNEPYLRQKNDQLPTFLYAMPLDSNLIFLEETSLVSRPVLSYDEIKMRMVARLRNLGIKVKRVLEDEKCLIPMGGPLPIMPQTVLSMGGAAGLVHPSTGYMVAKSLGTAGEIADAMVEYLGSTRMIRGTQLHSRLWNKLWPLERRYEREFYRFGMETLLRLDLPGTRRFFDAFFSLDPYYYHGFLSSKLRLRELASLGLHLFGNASISCKSDIISKCPFPLSKMVANLALQAEI